MKFILKFITEKKNCEYIKCEHIFYLILYSQIKKLLSLIKQPHLESYLLLSTEVNFSISMK